MVRDNIGSGDHRNLPLIAIMGQTASGKTDLAIELASELNGEIICADSRTIFRSMDVGTAKPTREEKARVPHFGLDLVEPGQRFTVYDFQKYARTKIAEIRARGHLPFLVGGSGLWIYSVLFDYDFDAKNTIVESVNLRHSGEKSLRRNAELVGDCIAVGLDIPRAELFNNIHLRTGKMFDSGLMKEANYLVEKYGSDCPQLQRNSYGEIAKFIHGEIDEKTLLENCELRDRQLAKKQRTWFRQMHDQIFWGDRQAVKKHIYGALDIIPD